MSTGKNTQSSRTTLLVLGGGTMQLPVITQAILMRIYVICVDANPHAEANTVSNEFWHLDIKNPQMILEKIYTSKTRIDGVLTCATDFTYSVAYIAHKLSLPSLSLESAEIANFKDKMRKTLAHAHIRIPQFRTYSFNLQQGLNLERIAEEADFTAKLPQICDEVIQHFFECEKDIVIKPVDNMGARGVFFISRKISHEEFMRAVANALSQSLFYSRHASVIIEEFIGGSELSIDSFIHKGVLYPLGLADRHIYCKPYFIETGHTIPSRLPKSVLLDALTLLEDAAQAAGIQNGICKGDIIIHDDDVYLGEFAARLSGGYMSGWTIPYTGYTFKGLNPSQIAILIALGRTLPIDEEVSKDEPKRIFIDNLEDQYACADRAVFCLPGKIREIRVEESLYVHPQFRNLFINIEVGEECKFPRNNSSKIGSLIFSKPNFYNDSILDIQLLSKIEFVIQKNKLAETFLFSKEKISEHIWRDFTFQSVELEERAVILNYFSSVESKQINENKSLIDLLSVQALPVYIPQDMLKKKELGIWSHCSIDEIIRVLVEQKIITLVAIEHNCGGGLFWSALLRGGWRGIQYMLRMGKKDIETNI